MSNIIRTLWLDDEGQDLAEYGLLLILVSTLVVFAIAALKDQVAAVLSRATSVLGS